MSTLTTHPRPTARLSLRTWTLYPQPPAEVSPRHDAAATRWFVLHEVALLAAVAWAVGAVAPSLLGLHMVAPQVVIGGGLLGIVVVLTAERRHLALRRRIGAPVIAQLHGAVAAAAPAWGDEVVAAFDLDNAGDPAAHEVRWRLKSAAKVYARRCEMTALADRWGWTAVRDRYIDLVTDMCAAACARAARIHEECR